MAQVRILKCVSCGEKCSGNMKQAHIFRWVRAN